MRTLTFTDEQCRLIHAALLGHSLCIIAEAAKMKTADEQLVAEHMAEIAGSIKELAKSFA